MDKYQISRDRMVREQLVARGIQDRAVLRAMATVPRHAFVEDAMYGSAYSDCPLPIGHGQTISQPYIVALMSELLEARPGMTVLEIGAGSGYQAAVLAQMGLEVYSVERLRPLYYRALDTLGRLRYHSVRLKASDGTEGWPEHAPFDRIIVTAGGPVLPQPLLDQLADPGLLVIPLGERKREQHLVRVRKENGEVQQEDYGQVAFVDLVGSHGW